MELQKITFNDIPQVLAELAADMKLLKEMLVEKGVEIRSNEPEGIMTIAEAAKFLNLTVSTVYGLNSKGIIPSMKKGKRLYFIKSDLIVWVKSGRTTH